MINICVPVLKRYDLLRDMLQSAMAGTLKPAGVYIVDNGCDAGRLRLALEGISPVAYVMTPSHPLGLAEAWNWFIEYAPAERLICNDDLLFGELTLERIAATAGDFVSALPGSNACSCFLLRDSCVAKVGQFDENISPGYAYFEDCDYVERLIQQGIPITGVECGVVHVGSQTIAKNTQEEWMEHHRKFLLAQSNFVAKWGRLPNVPGPHWPKPSTEIRVEVV
jgi:hypothetical protein